MDHNTSSSATLVIFDYLRANYPELINFLSTIDFSVCENLPGVDSIWHFVKNSILKGIHLFVPIINLKSSKSPKWYTSNIRHRTYDTKLSVCTLRRKCRSHPTEHKLHCIKLTGETLQHSIESAKINFEG